MQEFAAQVNSVATKVLNGEIDINVARTYSTLARTVAQAISSQVNVARMMKQTPNLELPEAKYEKER